MSILKSSEATKFSELFRKLDFEHAIEFYYMVKCMVLVNQKQEQKGRL